VRRPRVVIVDAVSVPGGAQRGTAALARRLPARGIDVAAAVGGTGPLGGWLRAAGIDVVSVSDHASDEAWATAIASLDPDVLLGVDADGHRLAGLHAATSGTPAVWWRMLTPRGRPRDATAAAGPTAAAICLTPAAARAHADRYHGPPVHVVPMGIDLDAVRRDAALGPARRAALGWADRPVIGMIARLDPAKGQETLLRAAARLLPAHPGLVVLVVGGAIVGHEGDLEARLRAQATEARLDDAVTFVGHVDDPAVWHGMLDVSVQAPTHEAFGLALLESMAVGIPVIATPTDGPRWILDEGRVGPLVAVSDDEALAVEILRLLDDPTLAAERARVGRQRADDFGIDAAAARVADVLLAVTATNERHDGAG